MNNMLDKESIKLLNDSGWEGTPAVDEVIAACDDRIKEILPNLINDIWSAYPYYIKDIGDKQCVTADTPEAVVTKFYLALKRFAFKKEAAIQKAKDEKNR